MVCNLTFSYKKKRPRLVIRRKKPVDIFIIVQTLDCLCLDIHMVNMYKLFYTIT